MSQDFRQWRSIYIYMADEMCPISWLGPERSRGVSLRIGLGQGEGSWSSCCVGKQSLNQHLLCRRCFPAGLGKPCHMRQGGLKQKKGKLKRLKCWLFNFLAPVFFSPTQYLPLTFKRVLPLHHTQLKVQTLYLALQKHAALLYIDSFKQIQCWGAKTARLRKQISQTIKHTVNGECDIWRTQKNMCN